jgi:hypothetical protein
MTTLRALTLSAIVLTALGCGEKDAVDTAPPCDVGIDETFPAAGATNAYYRGVVEAHLTDSDPTATITVDGVSGTSWLNEDEDVVYFEPDEAFAPNTDYTATISYCRADAPISFRTSDLGSSIADPASLVGNTYDLDLQSGRVVIPEGVGSVLEQYLEVVILFKIAELSGDDLTMYGALADEDDATQQDFCTPTLDFPPADFSTAPFFGIGPADTSISVAGYSVDIQQLEITGTFSADGSYWGGGVLGGVVDTRALKSLVGDDAEDSAVCDLVAGFGVSCVPCEDGTDFCLEIRAVDLSGSLIEGGNVEELEFEDCHASCVDTCADTDGDGTYDAFSNESCDLVFEDVCAQ